MEPRRRTFMKMILGSPLYPLLASVGCRGEPSAAKRTVLEAERSAAAQAGIDVPRAAEALEALISSPEEALKVLDFYPVAREHIPPAHWGNLATGSDDGATRDINAEAFQELAIRPRRFVDASAPDTSTTLLGVPLTSPIIFSPVSGQQAFHAEGEVGSATAAARRGHLMCLSGVASRPIEEVVAARGTPTQVFWQCYPSNDWKITERLIKRVEDAGVETMILTVDTPTSGNRLFQTEQVRRDARDCTTCHQGSPKGKRTAAQTFSTYALFDEMDLSGLTSVTRTFTRDFIARVRAATRMKLILKGIMTAEDARICLEDEIDAVWVSNHGGRQENSLMGTVEALPEVVEAVGGKIPVIVDSGVRWGTDVFKALALGATAVGIGRPQAWGLGAFGSAGAERVLELLQLELTKIMALAGTPTLAAISPAHVRYRTWGRPRPLHPAP